MEICEYQWLNILLFFIFSVVSVNSVAVIRSALCVLRIALKVGVDPVFILSILSEKYENQCKSRVNQCQKNKILRALRGKPEISPLKWMLPVL